MRLRFWRRRQRINPFFAKWILDFREERMRHHPWDGEYQVPDTIYIDKDGIIHPGRSPRT